jgi:hypothetical protein
MKIFGANISKLWIIGIFVTALLAGTAMATVLLHYNLTTDITVTDAAPTATITLATPGQDPQPLSTGSHTAVWTNLVAGQTYTQTLTIVNTWTKPFTVAVTLTAPTGWTYTCLSPSTTIAAGATMTSTLTLVVPSTATVGSYQTTLDITLS